MATRTRHSQHIGAGRQQDGPDGAAEPQEGIGVLAVDAHAEVNAELFAVAGFDRADRIAARDRVPRREG